MTGARRKLSKRLVALFLVTWAALLAAFVTSCTSGGGGVSGDLLKGKAPYRVNGVTTPERLTDGIVSKGGDYWDTANTSIWKQPSSSVEWDLGRAVHIGAAYLQGDNNDDFFLAVSADGTDYRDVWTAGSVQGAGMRSRHTRSLDVTARYVRVTARGGDPAVSASEVAVFETVPATFPPAFTVQKAKRPWLPGESEALVFGIVTALALLFHRWNQPSSTRALYVGAPILLGLWTWSAVMDGWPAQQPVIDMLRAVSAGVTAAAVLRLTVRPEDVIPRFVTGSLVAMAFLSLTTFFNMWQPQFEDVVDGRQTWVHTWDMRVYFPTAKYFDELGFDGLYLASVEAYLEDAPGASEARIANVDIRDLRDYEMTTIGRVSAEVHAVKDRFTPERWAAFKRDMAYFWKTMGAGGYLGSLRDHGGNATPAWLFAAYLMFSHAIASEPMLLRAALLDPLLLLGFAITAWRTFGLRTALVCLVIYGASTFPWFGSNWVGSTLRNDWMVLVGLGACALRKERHVLGGVLLAGAAMIRAFPAVAVFFLAAPFILWVSDTRSREGKIPDRSTLLREARPLLLALAGATATVVLLFVVSSLTFGLEHSWGVWAKKISLHSVSPNVNHVGLRTLFQFNPAKTVHALSVNGGGDWSTEQLRTLASRRPFYIAAMAAFTVLAFAASRRRDLRQAALIGMMMIPIYFYPSNYYLHYVFVLPLMFDYSEEPRERMMWGLVSFVMLCVCVSEYWGFEDVGVDERYVQWSVGVLVGYTIILFALARDDVEKTPVDVGAVVAAAPGAKPAKIDAPAAVPT